MLRILLLIGFLVVTTHAFDDYIYYPKVRELYKFHRTPKTWLDARETCRTENAVLAMPKNKDEVDVMISIFNGYPESILKDLVNPDQFSLGFHDMFEEGDFVSLSGVPLQYYFHKWNKGQPSNSNQNENCVSLFRNGELNDYPCNLLFVFICQKRKNSASDYKKTKCISDDPAYKYFDKSNKYYKLHLNPKTWPVARAICQAEGGNLAIINNKAEEDFLVNIFNKSETLVNNVANRDQALLGFHDLFKENYFVTVKDKDLQSTGYTNWHPGQPSNSGGNENCGSMLNLGGLNDYPCNIPAFFFCEIEPEFDVYPTLDERFSD